IIDLNLTSAFLCTKLIGGAMLPRKKGRVINVSSISGLVAGKSMRGRTYETSKAALAMFTKAVAADWASSGVTVNAIAPGPFYTNIRGGVMFRDPDVVKRFEEMVPMGRCAQPDEIKGLALLLASPAGSFITGTAIPVDGGTTAR
ncbi:MAG: SDR family oxidoreductase, partial [Candidatus Hydrogenedentales bacterium]